MVRQLAPQQPHLGRHHIAHRILMQVPELVAQPRTRNDLAGVLKEIAQ